MIKAILVLIAGNVLLQQAFCDAFPLLVDYDEEDYGYVVVSQDQDILRGRTTNPSTATVPDDTTTEATVTKVLKAKNLSSMDITVLQFVTAVWLAACILLIFYGVCMSRFMCPYCKCRLDDLPAVDH